MANKRDSPTNESNKKLKTEDEVINNDIKDKNQIKNGKNEESNEESNEDTFRFSESPTLDEIRLMHSKFCSDRNWDQFHSPRNVLLALVAEVGELSELFQWKNECPLGLKDWTPNERKSLGEELSDCLIYLIRLADRCRIDLPTAVLQKLALNDVKYPIDKVFGSSKKYTEYQ